MSRFFLTEEVWPDLCVYMVLMNINFLNIIFLDMNLLFFMFSFDELPLCAIFLSWAKNVFSYIHGPTGDNLHIFWIIIAFLRIQQKFYLKEELIEDTKGKFLV